MREPVFDCREDFVRRQNAVKESIVKGEVRIRENLRLGIGRWTLGTTVRAGRVDG